MSCGDLFQMVFRQHGWGGGEGAAEWPFQCHIWPQQTRWRRRGLRWYPRQAPIRTPPFST